ncbi:MAG: ComEC/Rec2 family competence protein [Candidatus Woesebacteria bacterium]|nr:MAG: ComEC/Rec2 family competence protein [Candidatus Woesebacteria bacterium]
MKYLIWFLLIFLIIFRYFTTRPVYHIGDRVRITTTILSDPVRYSTGQYLKVTGLKIKLPLFPEISYGDKIVVEGVVGSGKLEDPKLISTSPSKSFTSLFRNNIISFYQKALPEPEGGLLGGIVIGSKGALSPDFYNQTKLAGVAHVVVASGTNITFVVSFLMGVLTLYLTRRKAIVFAILGIILYLFVSGFDAPLVRAAIMSSIIFLGQGTGRMVSTMRILFLTAGAMLVYNPSWITDIGFILSFVSTASLMLFEKRINSKLLKIPSLLREGLSTSLAAQIGVAPILFVTFGQFNIWSPLINALVLWTIPYIMILGSVGGVVGLVMPFFGKIILWLSYSLLWWFVRIVELFS